MSEFDDLKKTDVLEVFADDTKTVKYERITIVGAIETMETIEGSAADVSTVLRELNRQE